MILIDNKRIVVETDKDITIGSTRNEKFVMSVSAVCPTCGETVDVEIVLDNIRLVKKSENEDEV